MRYSQLIGVLAAIICIIASFWLPWVTLGNITWTGHSAGTVFRAPGKMHVFLSALAIICFLIPKMIFKQANLVFVTLNMAWAIRNFLGMWRSNDSPPPTLNYGIYVIVLSGAVMLIMCLLAKLKLKDD